MASASVDNPWYIRDFSVMKYIVLSVILLFTGCQLKSSCQLRILIAPFENVFGMMSIF